jgi:hypothetical protein
MAKGDILKSALTTAMKGLHRKEVIHAAINEEMEQFTATGSFPPGVTSSEICEFLAPIDCQLTADKEEQLHTFANFLAEVDSDPTACAGYQLLGHILSKDLGL